MLTGVSGRAGAARAGRSARERPPRTGLARWRRWPVVAVLAGIALLFYCAQRQARQMGVQSDGAGMELEAWAMLHGNVLLHGWYLSDVSFYTTEMPEYVLVEIVRGLNPDVVRLSAALTYTLLVVLAAAVACGPRPAGRRTAAVRAGITVAVLLGPTRMAAPTVLNDPDHLGTAVPVLLALLLLDRAPRRWWVPAAVAAVLGWALVGDSLVLLIGVAPLVAVCGARSFGLLALRRAPLSAAWYELSLTAAGAAAAVGATALSRLIRSGGGFVVNPSKTHYLVPSSAVPGNASVTLEDFLRLFSADFFGARLNDWLLVTAIHLVFAGLVAAALVRALRGFRQVRYPGSVSSSGGVPGGSAVSSAELGPAGRPASRPGPDAGDLIAQLLAVAIVINLLAYGLLYPGSVGTVREIAPLFGLGGALAGRMLAGPLLRRRLEPLLAAGALAAIAALVTALVSVTAARPASVPLARFLSAHHLRNGLAGYWNADSTTLVSDDRVIMRSVRFRRGHGLSAYLWEFNDQWLDSQASDVNFVVATAPGPHPGSTVTSAEAIAQFGRPYQQYHYQGYVIMVWRKNLLGELGRSYLPG
ncbi:MAG: hypothetical protein ABSA02_32160 [Trebonia sp.]